MKEVFYNLGDPGFKRKDITSVLEVDAFWEKRFDMTETIHNLLASGTICLTKDDFKKSIKKVRDKNVRKAIKALFKLAEEDALRINPSYDDNRFSAISVVQFAMLTGRPMLSIGVGESVRGDGVMNVVVRGWFLDLETKSDLEGFVHSAMIPFFQGIKKFKRSSIILIKGMDITSASIV